MYELRNQPTNCICYIRDVFVESRSDAHSSVRMRAPFLCIHTHALSYLTFTHRHIYIAPSIEHTHGIFLLPLVRNEHAAHIYTHKQRSPAPEGGKNHPASASACRSSGGDDARACLCVCVLLLFGGDACLGMHVPGTDATPRSQQRALQGTRLRCSCASAALVLLRRLTRQRRGAGREDIQHCEGDNGRQIEGSSQRRNYSTEEVQVRVRHRAVRERVCIICCSGGTCVP